MQQASIIEQTPTSAAPWRRKVTIGDATLYLGDSLELLRAGIFGKLGAIFSDPPYGIGYQHSGSSSYKTGNNGTLNGGRFLQTRTCTIINDHEPFDPAPWLAAAPIDRPHSDKSDGTLRIVLWGADNFMRRLPDGGTMLAWDKHLGRGSDDSFADCEWAWVGRKVKREVFRHLWKGVAAMTLGLPFIGCEIDPDHFNVAVQRIQALP